MNMYIVKNNKEEYFVRILENNEVFFTKNKEDATKMGLEDLKELMPYIECQTGTKCISEIC